MTHVENLRVAVSKWSFPGRVKSITRTEIVPLSSQPFGRHWTWFWTIDRQCQTPQLNPRQLVVLKDPFDNKLELHSTIPGWQDVSMTPYVLHGDLVIFLEVC